MLKIYRVNTKTREIKLEEKTLEEAFLGGRAFIADTMIKEVKPSCDPLGEENKIIFATSMLAGSGASTALRLSIGTKSPLTGSIKEANCGGTFASAMSKQNIRAIIFEDKPKDDNWFYLKFDKEGKPELVDANEFRGMKTYGFVESMKEIYGSNISYAGIGVAGERMYKSASLQVTDHATGLPARAAARGGVGAVLGSKQIKGIIFEKSRGEKFPFADKKEVLAARKKYMEIIMNHPVTGLAITGTIASVDDHAVVGILPNHNFCGKVIPTEKLDKISVKRYLGDIKENGGRTGLACQPGCVIRCSNVYNNKKGEAVTAALEYETIGLCGSNLDIYDLEFIAEMDHLCDDFGVDTIEIGATLGVLMEAGKIPWGDKDAVLDAMKEMYEGTEFGQIVGNGAKGAGEYYNVYRTPVARGQAMPAYDPRVIKGMGVTFATNPMGADHTAGATSLPGIDHKNIEGQLELSAKQQIASAVYDSMMCMFGWYAFGFAEESLQVLVDLVKPMYGVEWSTAQMMDIGRQTLVKEYKFNEAAGFKLEDYKIADFMYEEMSEASGSKFDLEPEVAHEYVKSYFAE